jgi:hypothetical protein
LTSEGEDGMNWILTLPPSAPQCSLLAGDGLFQVVAEAVQRGDLSHRLQGGRKAGQASMDPGAGLL